MGKDKGGNLLPPLSKLFAATPGMQEEAEEIQFALEELNVLTRNVETRTH